MVQKIIEFGKSDSEVLFVVAAVILIFSPLLLISLIAAFYS